MVGEKNDDDDDNDEISGFLLSLATPQSAYTCYVDLESQRLSSRMVVPARSPQISSF